MALLWKMICNLGDPMSLRHPVPQARRQKSPLSIPRALQKRRPLHFLIPTDTVAHLQKLLTTILPTSLIALPYLLTLVYCYIPTYTLSYRKQDVHANTKWSFVEGYCSTVQGLLDWFANTKWSLQCAFPLVS